MRINSFKYEDTVREWRLDHLELNRLTLLVGSSGVGKTLILNALFDIKKIALGESLNGVKWFIDFHTLDKKHYIWEGAFKNQSDMFSDKSENGDIIQDTAPIISEQLWLNGIKILNRTAETIIYNGKETIKLSPEQSVINLLKTEIFIEPAYLELNKILWQDHSYTPKLHFSNLDLDRYAKKYNTLAKIQESYARADIKLFLISKCDTKVFKTIKEHFIDIFPQVTDIRIAHSAGKYFLKPVEDMPFVQIYIKEEGVNNWIPQDRISSGMLRTLIHIAELYLCTEGTVFLIDEFENSLGINCIHELTNDILKSKRQLQFVLTSHHPYIINNIHFDNWKLVTREGNVVKTHNAAEFNLGKSKHDAFMQLTQLEAYQTGIEHL